MKLLLAMILSMNIVYAKSDILDSLLALDKEAFNFEFYTKKCAAAVTKHAEDAKTHPHCIAFIQNLSKEKMLDFNKRFEGEITALKKLENSNKVDAHERYWVYQVTQKIVTRLKDMRDAMAKIHPIK